MNQGWKCPNCGKAHGPHVDTCPEPNPYPMTGYGEQVINTYSKYHDDPLKMYEG